VVHNAAELVHGRHISSIEGLWNEKYSGAELTTGDYVWNSVDVGLSFLPGAVKGVKWLRHMGKADDVVRVASKGGDVARIVTKVDDAGRLVSKTDDFVTHADDIVRMNKHHAWPKYLGGRVKQKFMRMPEKLHKLYRGGLRRVLPYKRLGAGGSVLHYWVNASKARRIEMMRKMVKHTKVFDRKHGTSLLKAFVEELKAVGPGILTP